jgi:multidrug efflux pump
LGQAVEAGFQPALWLNSMGWKSTALIVAAGLIGSAAGWLAGGFCNVVLGGFFRGFNTAFRLATHGYTRTVGLLLRLSVIVLVVYGGLLALTYYTFTQTPKGFIPTQDMGYLLVNVQLPDAASMERTEQVMKQVYKIAKETKGVRHVTTIAGQSFVLNAIGSNFGSVFINLQDYADRRDPSLHGDQIAARLRARYAAEVSDAMIAVFGPPPVRGAGRAGGFAIMIEDRGSLGLTALQRETEKLVRMGNVPDPKETPWVFGPDGKPKIVGLFSVFRANVPQLKLIGDTREFSKKGVSTKDFADTLSIFEGSLYVNDFNLFGRTWEVIIQAEPEFRTRPEDLGRLKVRNARGGMVPLGSLGTAREVNGPLALTRYNMYPAASINGTSGMNVSSADAINIMQQLAERELPKAMAYEWTDMSYLELLAGDTATVIFGFAVVMVFLVLAALYESWSLPMAVILVVPMCLLSALAGVNFVETDVNIFTRIGFVVLVGLASKNAILIVEFAKVRREQGESRRQATLEACQLRLRPIIMTSLAFILGVLPLVVAHGAGMEMRRALGLAVFSGMIGVTLFGIFLTPVFFYVINWLTETHLFTARRVELAGEIALDVMTLGFRRWADIIRQLRRPRPTRVPVVQASRPAPVAKQAAAPVANGDSNGNGNGNGDGIVTALPQTPAAHPDGFAKQK